MPTHKAPVILLALVAAHIIEIILYAVVYALASGPLAAVCRAKKTMATMDYFYCAAET